MRTVPAVAVLLLVTAVPCSWAYPMPPSSAARAARYDEWRSRIEQAEREADRGAWESAAASFSAVVEEARASEDRSLLLARALDGLGRARARAGSLEDAVRLHDEAAALFAQLLGERQPRVAVTLHNLGVVCVELGRFEQARSAFERALAIFEGSLGPGSEPAILARRELSGLDARAQPAPDLE